jgi:hypothetical protein
MILEPYNTRYVSNPNIDLETIKSDIEMNKYNISLKQNKLNAGNNIKIVDNMISVVGVSGVESNFYYVNQLRNDVDSSFVEINDLITNITIDSDLSNSVYDLSSSVEALYLDVSNLNISKQPNIHEGDLLISDTSGLELALSTKQPTIHEGDLLISDTSGLELALSNKQDAISFSSDICLNDLHVHGNIIIDGSLNVNNLINTTINNEILVSTQLDISNEGTGPALKVSQLGSGDNNSVALFNAGSEGDALLIDSSGNTSIYKELEVFGDVSMNQATIQTLNVSTINASNIVGYQETLIAGTNITITGNTISSTGGGSLPADANFSSVNTSTLNTSTIDSSGRVDIGDADGQSEGLVLTGNAPTITLKDTDARSGMIHMNDSKMYFLSGGTNSEAWSQVDGEWPLILDTSTNEAQFGGIISAPNQVSFKATTNNALRTINNDVIPDFENVVYNVGGGYDNTTYKFTAPVAGKYFLGVIFYTNVNNKYTLDLLLNDTTLLTRAKRQLNSSGGYTTFEIICLQNLNVGDVVYSKVTQNTSIAINAEGSNGFFGFLIS